MTPEQQEQQTIRLDMPVQFLKGVGPSRAEAFAKYGVETVADLLEYYPRDWNFFPEPVKIDQLRPNQKTAVIGLIESTDYQSYRRTPMFEVLLADETGICRVVWFHGGYLANQLGVGQMMMVSGKVTLYKHQLQFSNPKFLIIEKDSSDPYQYFSGGVYPAGAQLSSAQIKRIVAPVIEQVDELVPEFYEPAFLKKQRLVKRADAFRWIHRPDDPKKLDKAKRRLKYDELFLMQLGLAIRRYQHTHSGKSIQMRIDEQIDHRIRKRFPFLLTGDQDTVIEEIIADMASETPMNRLLQGDVGSGKTVVALYAALAAVANKCQVAVMAPTEILAAQHFISMERYLKRSRVTRELITGGITGKSREDMLNRIRTGKVDIVAGTVALLQADIEFANLGLVIIDEQHKFGVHQRASLRKDHTPHCLVMTATPIPRTLAMTVFGDLDVSVIRHCPPGRTATVTRRVEPENRDKAYDFIRQRLKAGRQAYFVCPRIAAEDANGDIKAAVTHFEHLSKEIFPEYRVELLHGQMPSEQKQKVMDEFRRGRINVLVSTVVIEVGVDVPNATIMVIEGADRFGLAQLHQLRGRIGRGQAKSYCLLFAETDNEIALKRLEIMTRCSDGFEIAEEDLRIRGPGELFSTRQHGLPDLKIANIIDDYELLVMARRDAMAMIENDPQLKQPQHTNIRRALLTRFGETLKLADIA